MKIGDKLRKELSKKFAPSSTIDREFGKYALTLKTDEAGNAVLAFLGSREESGDIKGFRYVRTLIRDQEGKVVKDHWDNHGKV
ncbi:hypothetical protein [Salmonirosea aquatica]|uniref:Uncharacterized protein n=1 Tax=Salmonirosea aquatica TaxID=2654236 RepID=A0A7C9BDY8_9BACT|nr:hypothetical protein [Cytophagaceae bacterium SJW1-29]